MPAAENVRVPGQVETARRRAKADPHESEQKYRALAGAVAHEFNNLLTVISGYASLLNEDLDNPEELRRRIGEIIAASNRGRELTNKLLVISGKQPYENDTGEVDKSAPLRGGIERVLIVDDDTGVRALTSAILSRLGYQIVAANGAAEAIRLAREGLRFDLIVTDIVMPGVDGGQLVSELRAISCEFEVLYVSGFAESGSSPALDADPAHFLAKPFTAGQLALKVRELLDRTHGS